jgi:hypothetical protein
MPQFARGQDCPFHRDIVDAERAVVLEGDRKQPVSVGVAGQKVTSAVEDRRRRRGG